MKINWTTERGSKIEVSIDEATEVNADGDSVTVENQGLEVSANGNPLGFHGVVTHPDVGLSIKVFGDRYIPIPSDKADDVMSMIDEHTRRRDEANVEERAYENWAEKIEGNR